MAEVTLDHVCKEFPGGVRAVNDFTLSVQDREFVVFVGPSGCGKSTTLRMIAGLEEITGGTVKIGERVVNDLAPKDRDIAMVFQNYALYPHMNVYDNLSFGLRLQRFPRDEIETRVQEAAKILGLSDMLDRKPKQLSGGQRQRVAVGRAIVRKPAAFLFDEPLSNLDAKLRGEMRAELNKLHQRLNVTMIYVTHDQMEAMTLANRIVVMKDGWIQQIDPPLAVYDRPVNKFVAGFIGTPPMNFLNGRVEERDGTCFWNGAGAMIRIRDEVKDLVSQLSGKEAVLGIRPEDLHDRADREGVPDHSTVSCRVDVVEILGDEQYVYLSAGDNAGRMIAKFDAHHRVEVGDSIEVVLNLDRIHVFDTGEGKNHTLREALEEAAEVGKETV